ncbi:hypothetical protein BGW80DRAFT_1457583 [Lactifluus volemus]|nr:hypothetical protein BGW80DRAFT_1457583 [Lactifluus volemus]
MTWRCRTYLTALSDAQVISQASPWKRFVRDDFEIVRIERAGWRVRFDVAAHITSSITVHVTKHDSSVLGNAKRTAGQ